MRIRGSRLFTILTLIIVGFTVLFFSCGDDLADQIKQDLEDTFPEIVLKQGIDEILPDLTIIDFSKVNVGESKTLTFTIENTGEGDLLLTGDPKIEITLSDLFEVTSEPPSKILGGTNSTFTIKFTPSDGTTYNAQVTINTNDSDEGTFTFFLTGSGKKLPEINVKQGETFEASSSISNLGLSNIGYVTIGTTRDFNFYIENLGSENLILTSTPYVSLTSTTGFTMGDQPVLGTIAPGSHDVFTLRFNPIELSLYSATVTIESNDETNSTFTFTVSGRGSDCEINILQNGIPIVDNGSPYNFDEVGVDESSGNISFEIENSASGNLFLTGNPVAELSGTNEDEFSIVSMPDDTIAGGTSDYLVVSFDPTSFGEKNATVTIANNDEDENPYEINLTGTGMNSDIHVSQGGTDLLNGEGLFTFDEVIVNDDGTPVSFLVENLGNEALQLTGTPLVSISGPDETMFSVTSAPLSTVTVENDTSFSLQFSPTGEPGEKTAYITIDNNDVNESSYTFTVRGTGISPEMTINSGAVTDGGSYPFADTVVTASSAPVTFTITNSGTSALNLTGTPKVAISGTDSAMFTVGTQPATPVDKEGGSTTFTIVFSPSSNGEKTAEVSIVNDTLNENPYNFTITGTGITPEINVQDTETSTDIPDGTGTYDFGDVAEGYSSTEREFRIENLGAHALELTGTSFVEIIGTHANLFSIESQPASSTVAAGGEALFTLLFTPDSAGLKTAEVSIESTDLDEAPYTFEITGTGLTPEMKVIQGSEIADDGSHSMGNVNVGSTSSAVTFTIENNGDAALDLTGSPRVSISEGDSDMFSVGTQPSTPVSHSGGSTTFTMYFSPTSFGTKSSTVSIANNDLDENPYNFTIFGTGMGPEMHIQRSSTNVNDGGSFGFGNENVNVTKSYTFTIYNNGNAALNLSGNPRVAVSGTNASMFGVTAQPASSVAVSGSTTFTVGFTPTSSGTKSATISITNNDWDESTYDFTVTGTGTVPEINVTRDTSQDLPDGSGSYCLPVRGVNYTGPQYNFQIHSTGTGYVRLTGDPYVQFTGDDSDQFTISDQPGGYISSGNASTFWMQFTPTSMGPKTSTVTISNNDSDENPYTFSISGMAGGVDYTLSSAKHIIVDSSGNYAYTDDDILSVYDITNKSAPDRKTYIGGTTGGGIALYGDIIYAVNNSSIAVYDVTTPTSPSLVRYVHTNDTIHDLQVYLSSLYVANGDSGIKEYSLSSPSNPVYSWTCNTSTSAEAIDVDYNYIYVAGDGGNLSIISRTGHNIVGTYSNTGDIYDLVYYVNDVYAACNGGLYIINVSNPASPSLKVHYTTNLARAYSICIDYPYAYVSGRPTTLGQPGIYEIDITATLNPSQSALYSTTSTAYGLIEIGSYIYFNEQYFSIIAP